MTYADELDDAEAGRADLDALEALLAGAHARLNAREEHTA